MSSLPMWQQIGLPVLLAAFSALIAGGHLTETKIIEDEPRYLAVMGVVVGAICFEWANYTLWALLILPARMGHWMMHFSLLMTLLATAGIIAGLASALLACVYRYGAFKQFGVAGWRRDMSFDHSNTWTYARFRHGVVEDFRDFTSRRRFPRVTFNISMFLGPGAFLVAFIARFADRRTARKVYGR